MDELEQRRQRKARQRATQPAGAFGPSSRKLVTINRVLAKVDAAAERRDPAAGYAGKTPTPERITMALNLAGLYGPEVDQALGGEEPMVDEWESGARIPTFGQIQALAVLTGYGIKFFYMPAPAPISGGWICGKGGCRPLAQD